LENRELNKLLGNKITFPLTDDNYVISSVNEKDNTVVLVDFLTKERIRVDSETLEHMAEFNAKERKDFKYGSGYVR
jgi:hypothetical protein